MTNLITRTTEFAMRITLEYICEGDIVIDATCGTGRDTAVLARAVGSEGTVYAFDIQREAIDLTREIVGEEGLSNVKLIWDSFTSMGSYVPEGSAAAVVFNLGYLPGGNHDITTKTEDTLEALDLALKTIRPGGIVTVVMYGGHEEGAREKSAVLDWARFLDRRSFHVAYTGFINQENDPPEILWITRKK